jgi:hypothetical protein
MPFTQHDLDTLLTNRAQESLYLEFKRGVALRKNSDTRRELIKDCTGLANAAGGLIVYGIAEEEIDGVRVASTIEAVPTDAADSAGISEILRTNTSPPLTRFNIIELALPENSGRIVAIEIEAAGTAHQNLLDLRYYQRAGSTTAAMTDFQIRDVMNRRTKPEVDVFPNMRRLVQSSKLHRYLLEVDITNVGMVSLEKWRFEIDVPAEVVTDTSDDAYQQLDWEFHVSELVAEGRKLCRITFADPHPIGHAKILHPQQSIGFRSKEGTQESSEWYPRIVIEVTDKTWEQIRGFDIPWRLYMLHNAPVTGVWPFERWCRY